MISDELAVQCLRGQCAAIEAKGYEVQATISKSVMETRAFIIIGKNTKAWRFADPDLQVIISQLCEFYENVINKKSRIKKIIDNLKGI